MADGFEGINQLQELLKRAANAAEPERIVEAQKKGADFLADRLRGRSAPKRSGKMLSSFTSQSDQAKGETVFGWGVFYGRLVESGHKAGGWARKKKASITRVKPNAHLLPTFTANKEQVFRLILEDLERG